MKRSEPEGSNLEAFKALLSVAESMARIQGADFSEEEFKWARAAIARMEPASLPVIDAAREEYASDDVEIDDDAVCSMAESGAWVSAWVWVADAVNELKNRVESP